MMPRYFPRFSSTGLLSGAKGAVPNPRKNPASPRSKEGEAHGA
jgi:hypothetical protein